ncbi:MAG: hypothetical protein ACK4HV_05820, partial [Parachlamydiaceae bacterium]
MVSPTGQLPVVVVPPPNPDRALDFLIANLMNGDLLEQDDVNQNIAAGLALLNNQRHNDIRRLGQERLRIAEEVNEVRDEAEALQARQANMAGNAANLNTRVNNAQVQINQIVVPAPAAAADSQVSALAKKINDREEKEAKEKLNRDKEALVYRNQFKNAIQLDQEIIDNTFEDMWKSIPLLSYSIFISSTLLVFFPFGKVAMIASIALPFPTMETMA